jgi:hypothetical protein
MAGRNESCPCGSGKKYKKCCLTRDERQSRETAVTQRLQAEFAEVVRAIHSDAVRDIGTTALDEWSDELQSEAVAVDGQIFQDFAAFHRPWQSYPSLAARYLDKSKPGSGAAEIVQAASGEPYSIWQVEDGKAKDLLRGLQSPVLSHPLLQTSLGRCLFAKLLEQDGQRALLSAYPVALPKATAEKLLRKMGSKGRPVTTEHLLDSQNATQLYQTWRVLAEGSVSEVGRRSTERGIKIDSLYQRLICRDVYRFDAKRRPWLLNAFDQAVALRRHKTALYHFPACGAVDGVIELHDTELVARSFSPGTRDALERAVAETAGSLLTFVDRRETNLMDHLLEAGLDEPVLPGMPSVGEMLTSEQRIEMEASLGQLRAAGFGEPQPLTVSGLISAFVCHREERVSAATLRRDVEAMRMLEGFTEQSGWQLARKEPDGPFNDTFGGEWLPSLLAPFLYFVRLSEAHHGPTRTRGAFTTTRHLIRWLDETGRLSDEERDWVMEALAEHG